ncbi:hypothetical protein ABW20_dc0109172 [Dactylellina cionopaga]|nr:hypothetical protein ABW20_dc0109172 [Dactylellina cionopaga]
MRVSAYLFILSAVVMSGVAAVPVPQASQTSPASPTSPTPAPSAPSAPPAPQTTPISLKDEVVKNPNVAAAKDHLDKGSQIFGLLTEVATLSEAVQKKMLELLPGGPETPRNVLIGGWGGSCYSSPTMVSAARSTAWIKTAIGWFGVDINCEKDYHPCRDPGMMWDPSFPCPKEGGLVPPSN